MSTALTVRPQPVGHRASRPPGRDGDSVGAAATRFARAEATSHTDNTVGDPSRYDDHVQLVDMHPWGSAWHERIVHARLMAWFLAVLVLISSSAAAQPLPADAAEALARAQRLAASAHLAYERHFPDQELWREALAAGREAASLAPDALAPRRFLGQAYTTVQWYSRAWTAWQGYLDRGGAIDAQVERQLVLVAGWLGVTTFDGGRRDDAVPYLETVLRFTPDDVSANERMARWYLDQGAFEEALPHVEALAERTDSFGALVDHARRGARYGAAAADAYEAALVARSAGQLRTAITRLETATEAAPGFVEAWLVMADLHATLDDPAAAAAAYQRVVALAPDDEAAQAGLERALTNLDAARSSEPEPTVTTAPSQPPAPAPIEPAPAEGPTETAAQPVPPTPPTAPVSTPREAPLLLVDRQIEHRAASAAGSGAFTFVATPPLRRDLSGFATGTLYQRVEVLSKPSEALIRYQVCLVPEDITVSPACSDASRLAFTTPGTFSTNQSIASLGGASNIAWRQGITSVMLVLRNHENTPVDDRTLVGTGERASLDMSDYYPMTVRYQAMLVPAGASFPGWP